MGNAVLYFRVSTKEQKETGYRLTDQANRLKAYCSIQKINILKIFIEEYSAKDFNRPEFRKMFDYVKLNKSNVDNILFVKWDRFSQNATESFEMINKFKKMGVTVNSVEQPIDLNIPENKIMLAFYLASREVDNDKRSINARME